MTWTRERWTRVEALFHEVAQVAVAERPAAVDAACGGDTGLRAALLRLLAADEPGDDELIDRGVGPALRGDDALLQQQFGAFRLVERIAEGGMGAVYRAERVDGDFEQEAAVKVLRLGLSTPVMRERFARERQTLARLVHPNVARLFDGGTTGQGVPFIAMELVDGVPLDRFCDQQQAPLRRRLRLFVTICRAVQFAHQNLIVHLDLKPGNILVDAHGQPKLVDFGVAGLLEGMADDGGAVAVTRTRPLTPEYASPELVRGEPVSTAADVYSLGVVLYELLTGVRAFRPTRNDIDLMRTVCETEAPRPSSTFVEPAVAAGDAATDRARRGGATAGELVRALRGDLDRIVQKAMSKEVERRYASCREFAEDVERFLAGFPVAAREPSLGYRTRKFFRRHGLAVTAIAAVLLALCAGIVSTAHMATVARAERDLAATAKQDAERERDLAAAARREAELQRDAAAAARVRVAHEAEHAGIEASSSQIVADFLGDTFLSAQFLVTSEQRERALATIERKAEQVRRQLADNDHLRANLLDALGRACTRIDAPARAEALLLEAAAIRRQHFGDESIEHALSLGRLGELYYRQGRVPEAVGALREAYRLQRECPVGVHTDVARAANDLAAAERASGNVARARDLHQEALQLRREGGDRALVAESLNNLANSEPDPASAREHLEEALRLRREVLGDDDPLTVQCEANLGNLCLRLGQFEAARGHLRGAVERGRELGWLGAETVVVSLRSLAYAELRLGRIDAATTAIDEAVAIERQRLGGEHPRLADCLEMRARIEQHGGRWQQAVSTWREVLQQRESSLPAGDRLVALSKCSLGTALARADDPEQGAAWAREGYAALQQAPTPNVGDLADAGVGLALAEEAAGRLREAEELLLEARRLCAQDAAHAARAAAIERHLREFLLRHDRPEDAAGAEPR